MSIRTTKLGGTDFSDGEVLYAADLNDSLGANTNKIDESYSIFNTLKDLSNYSTYKVAGRQEVLLNGIGSVEKVETSSTYSPSNSYALIIRAKIKYATATGSDNDDYIGMSPTQSSDDPSISVGQTGTSNQLQLTVINTSTTSDTVTATDLTDWTEIVFIITLGECRLYLSQSNYASVVDDASSTAYAIKFQQYTSGKDLSVREVAISEIEGFSFANFQF